MRALAISLAKHINGALARTGKVFEFRDHTTALTSPRQVRNAIAYVLNNCRRHREDENGGLDAWFWKLDRYASATHFAGLARLESRCVLALRSRTGSARTSWCAGSTAISADHGGVRECQSRQRFCLSCRVELEARRRMRRSRIGNVILGLTVILLTGCASPPTVQTPRDAASPALVDWQGGLPPLDRVSAADFAPAFSWAMQRKREELERIAGQPEPATFDNTIGALERAGLALADLRALFDLWGRAFRDEAYDAAAQVLAPQLAAFDAEVLQEPRLASRVEAVWRTRGKATAEQRRVIELVYQKFAPARRSAPERARIIALDTRIEALYAQFNETLAAGTAATAVVLRDEADLVGLPAAARQELAANAAARSLPGAWIVKNQYNAIQAFLAASPRRDLRERVWQASKHRADRAPHDNTAAVTELLALRAERARLVGHASYAAWKTERSMISASRARAWLLALAGPASAQARTEISILQHAADQQQDAAHAPRFTLQPWDLRYYEEQVRTSQYRLDEAEVASYLELDRIRDAAFWVSGQLFGLEITALPDAPVPARDVTVWAVAKAGKRIGVLVFDPHPRPGKDGGAWALALRDQQRLVPGRVPVVSVHYNLARDHLTWFEAVGVFHELGHALQALLSDVTYPSVAGLNIAGDTLEMASQWFERYLATPEVLARFTRHETKGTPMPAALVERIERARNFAEGIRTMAMLQTSVLDLDLHSRSGPFDLAALERAAATAAHAPPAVSSVGGAVQAGFLFGGENYSAQFYSYLWSDALAAEVYEAFLAGQGPYDRAVAERLRAHVLARGDSVEPADAYQRVVGKEVGIDALLRKRGLALACGANACPHAR